MTFVILAKDFVMGNSGYEQIRKDHIKKRDERILEFMPQFEQIVRDSGLSAERVEEIISI